MADFYVFVKNCSTTFNMLIFLKFENIFAKLYLHEETRIYLHYFETSFSFSVALSLFPHRILFCNVKCYMNPIIRISVGLLPGQNQEVRQT